MNKGRMACFFGCMLCGMAFPLNYMFVVGFIGIALIIYGCKNDK